MHQHRRIGSSRGSNSNAVTPGSRHRAIDVCVLSPWAINTSPPVIRRQGSAATLSSAKLGLLANGDNWSDHPLTVFLPRREDALSVHTSLIWSMSETVTNTCPFLKTRIRFEGRLLWDFPRQSDGHVRTRLSLRRNPPVIPDARSRFGARRVAPVWRNNETSEGFACSRLAKLLARSVLPSF